MDRSLALAAALAAAAAALPTGAEELSIHAKSLAAASAMALAPSAPNLAVKANSPAPARAVDAPFVSARPRDPLPELLLREELDRRGPAASCEASATDLCYDVKEARIVYKPARTYMPSVPGLRAESISLRHDRIVYKYSFR